MVTRWKQFLNWEYNIKIWLIIYFRCPTKWKINMRNSILSKNLNMRRRKTKTLNSDSRLPSRKNLQQSLNELVHSQLELLILKLPFRGLPKESEKNTRLERDSPKTQSLIKIVSKCGNCSEWRRQLVRNCLICIVAVTSPK